jgi:hypothetical protein
MWTASWPLCGVQPPEDRHALLAYGGVAGRKAAVSGPRSRCALDEVRRRSLLAIPVCPFIASLLRKHPEYQELVSPESRRTYRI